MAMKLPTVIIITIYTQSDKNSLSKIYYRHYYPDLHESGFIMKLLRVGQQLSMRYNSGIGNCLKLGGYLSYQNTFVWRKLHSYGVIVKIGGALI